MSYCLPPTVMKSNYNFTCCLGCGKPIKRGDAITFVSESRGMILRPVECINGLYTPCTGRRIVHKDCDVIGLWTEYGSNSENKDNKNNSNYDYCDLESDSDSDSDMEINKDSNYDLCDNKNDNHDISENDISENDINQEPIIKKGWFW